MPPPPAVLKQTKMQYGRQTLKTSIIPAIDGHHHLAGLPSAVETRRKMNMNCCMEGPRRTKGITRVDHGQMEDTPDRDSTWIQSTREARAMLHRVLRVGRVIKHPVH
jgi:hypothetical protein